MSSMQELAARLHAQVCQSRWWSTDCQSASGGAHARKEFSPIARAALGSGDPAGFLHTRFCDALLDSTFGACPDEVEHTAAFADLLR